MLRSLTAETIHDIATNPENKPKDRLDACKLLLSTGLYVEELCKMLHHMIESGDYSDQIIVKCASLLNTYEPIPEEKTEVVDTAKAENDLKSKYGINWIS